MNKLILIGRLTKDPEARYSQNGTCVANFTLAVDRRKESEDGTSADFINCVAFGKTGELVENYLNKGKLVAVSGSIQTRSYTTSDGDKRYVTEAIVNELQFLSKKDNTADGIEFKEDEDCPF